jgi:hypothetical protein
MRSRIQGGIDAFILVVVKIMNSEAKEIRMTKRNQGTVDVTC